jgi:hypothetical protein
MLAAKILCHDFSLFSILNTLMMLRRELFYAGATVRPNSDGDTSPRKYILKFTSEQIHLVTFTFLIVVPVNLSEIGIKRWCCAHLDVLDYRLPRSHPIVVVTIKEAYVYCGEDIDYMTTEDEMINLPSELTPGEVRPWSPARSLGDEQRPCDMAPQQGQKLDLDRSSQV